MNYKQKIDEYIKSKTSDLEFYFFRFCTENEKNFFPNLLSDLYIHLIEKQDKLEQVIDKNELHYYCIKYIYNQRNWQNTSFKNDMVSKENYSDSLASCNIAIDNSFDAEEQACAENIEQENRLNKIRLAYHNFTQAEKVLYKKYFIEQQSMRSIANEIGVPTTSIFKGIKNLKEKIQSTEIQ
jgi:DNA-directed RNA polymerase specialized sigma subunit